MKRLLFLFFAGTFVVLLTGALLANGVHDPGDGVMHHLIARYSFQHPWLFLHHWGKPFYTLLSSPFAQFGYNGSVVFNLACHMATGWLTWKTAERLKIPFATFAAPLAIFAPVALPVAISGLTEPLFALVLISGVYAVTISRPMAAAILISFLPFVRTEGFFLAPLFGLVFLLRKDFISFLLLGTGTVIYSAIGYFHFGDLLWIVHQNPYKGAENIYGHGSLFHFIGLSEFIWGWALTLLLILGTVALIFHRKLNLGISRTELILVAGCFFVFLVLHSVFWWKGLFGSLGLHRVMACTMPLAVLVGLRGLQLLFLYVKKMQVRLSLIAVILVIQVFLSYRQHPVKLTPAKEEKIMFACRDWMKEKTPPDARVYCAHPYMAMLLDKDPFDPEQWQELYPFADHSGFRQGDLIIWDSHFGPNERMLPFEQMSSDSNFHELARFGELPANKQEQGQKFMLALFAFEKASP